MSGRTEYARLSRAFQRLEALEGRGDMKSRRQALRLWFALERLTRESAEEERAS